MIKHSIVGIRSRVERGIGIEDRVILLGYDYYESGDRSNPTKKPAGLALASLLIARLRTPSSIKTRASGNNVTISPTGKPENAGPSVIFHSRRSGDYSEKWDCASRHDDLKERRKSFGGLKKPLAQLRGRVVQSIKNDSNSKARCRRSIRFRNSGASVKKFRYLGDGLFLISCSLYAIESLVHQAAYSQCVSAVSFQRYVVDSARFAGVAPDAALASLAGHGQNRRPGARSRSTPVFWSILFEVIGPHLMRNATGDPWDVVVCFLGGIAAGSGGIGISFPSGGLPMSF